MNLKKQKELTKRTLKVGKKRIIFSKARLEDIKEAITKQDIRDLHEEKAILIKDIKGRSKVSKRKRKRKTGKIKKKVKSRKKDYVEMTRKLRKYFKQLRDKGKITPEEAREIRKKIRNKAFKSQSQLKNYVESKQKG